MNSRSTGFEIHELTLVFCNYLTDFLQTKMSSSGEDVEPAYDVGEGDEVAMFLNFISSLMSA